MTDNKLQQYVQKRKRMSNLVKEREPQFVKAWNANNFPIFCWVNVVYCQKKVVYFILNSP